MTENGSQSKSKTPLKFFLNMMGLGILVVLALVSVYVPRMILWYYEPGASLGISCTPTVRSALEKLIYAQGYAVLGGAIIGLLVGNWIYRRRTK